MVTRLVTVVASPLEHLFHNSNFKSKAVQAVEAWKHLDFLCHNYILNGLVDSLCNVYYKTMTAKELWESLERKYKTEDAGIKKFAVARFLDYKMVYSKNVITQKNTYTPNSAKANMVENARSSLKSNSKAKEKGKEENEKKRKGKEIRSSYRLYDEVVQDKRQQDDNDLQDESQDQPKEEEVEPRRSKRARTDISF
nr:hypothetical protein [Tanacetum cinerariifolium]